MIQEQVIICDECKSKIAKYKCELCDRDCCSSCLSSPYLTAKGMRLFDYPICRECAKKLNLTKIELSITDELKNEMKKQISKQIHNALLLSALENKEESDNDIN